MKADLHLERQALGEDDVVHGAAVLALRADNARILSDHPPDAVLAEVKRRAVVQPKKVTAIARRWLWLPGPALAATLLIALWLRPVEPDTFKGEAALTLTRGSSLLKDGDIVSSGDVVAIAIAPAGAAHAVLVSLDGNGGVTLHHPLDSSSATAAPRGTFMLDRFRLDDAPGFERFVLVTAAAPLDVATVLKAADVAAHGVDPATSPLRLPFPADQHSVVLRK
jgi:hypothetical protein